MKDKQRQIAVTLQVMAELLAQRREFTPTANDRFACEIAGNMAPHCISTALANFLVSLKSDLDGSDVGTGMTEGEWAEHLATNG